MALTLGIVGGTILAAILLVVLRWLLVRRQQAELVFHCPGCKLKIRYKRNKAGRSGTCPRCAKTYVLPATPVPTPPTAAAGQADQKGRSSKALRGHLTTAQLGNQRPGGRGKA
jgi:hypothetical protein